MLKLRELERGDLAEITSWRSSRGLISTLGAPYRYIGPEIDESWFDGYLASRGSCVRCVAVDDGTPREPMSLVTLSGIDWVNRACEFHIMVGEAYQGRGVGRFSAEGLLRHAFCDLGMERVELSVLDGNARARSLYESLGFVVEGTRRSAVFKEGARVDLVLMSLLRDEWLAAAGARCEGGVR